MTRLIKFANNATSRLAANLSAVGTTVSVTPGEGAKFPVLTTGQFFMATLVKADGTKEAVKVTARSSDTMTIVRAVEAVGGVQTAFSFTAGDKFELRLTADSLSNELDRLDAAAFLNTVTKTANYTITEADVCSLIKTDTTAGNITHTLPLISSLTGSFEIQISKNTGDANTVTVVRSGSDTINGINSYNLSAQYQCVWLVADLVTNTWTAITSASASNRVTDSFIGAGSAGPFTLSGQPGSKNNTDVYVGGVYQQKSTYTLTGDQLTLGGAVSAGVFVECMWSQPISIGTPSDGTVSPAKLNQATIGAEYALIGSVAGTNTITGTIAGIASYAPGQTFRFIAAGANTGAVTLNINSLGAKAVTKSGTQPLEVGDIASGAAIQVVYDGTQFQLVGATASVSVIPPGAIGTTQAQYDNSTKIATTAYTDRAASSRVMSISASVGSNALTISASNLSLDFRSATLGSGTVTTVQGTPANLVISSGSTLGTVNAQQSRIVVLAINNAGTIELAAVNIAGGNQLDECNLISTMAEGGAGAADSASTIYSTTARSNVAYRVIGYVESTQATAGTWATAPSTIQGAGGNALAAMQSLGYGQTWQLVTGSRALGTTYYNTTGRPIAVAVPVTGSAVIATLTIGGVVPMSVQPVTSSLVALFGVVPPGMSYVVTGSATINSWSELR